MKFVNNTPGQPYFWIEDYTQEEKEFFLQIGFKEKTFGPNVPFPTKSNPNASAQIKNLIFTGSQVFGLWSKKEIKEICNKIYDQFPHIDQIEVETSNPYD